MSRLSVQGRRWRALAVLAGGALFAHAALLDALDAAWLGRGGVVPQAAVVQVRTVDAARVTPAERMPPAAPAAAATTAAAPRSSLPQAVADAGNAGKRVAAAKVPPRTTGGARRREATVLLPIAAAQAAEAAPAAASPTPPPAAPTPPPAAPAASGDAETAPLYRTHFAPALTLHYDLRRGLLQGSGDMLWRPAGERYELGLDGRVAGLAVLTQRSQGGFDAAGLAPERFTDQRLRGAVRAANFQRTAGKITFSGPSDEYPLVPGVQDRLSWMIQLAAVLDAEPQHAAEGGRVTLPVVGARADMGLWTFRFDGPDRVATASGDVATWRFSREPRGAHDTHVEVWLDPARHHLPVRATMRNAGEGEPLELLLRSVEPAP